MELYSVREVVGADPKTFYSKRLANSDGHDQLVGFDANGVFWGAEEEESADIENFEYVGNVTCGSGRHEPGNMRDTERVFGHGYFANAAL